MEWIWIRHGMTKGNMEKRYIGCRTDEGLCDAGRRMLLEKKALGLYPQADVVYVSPMKRCLETAEILYPDAEKRIVPGFRECDFGLFENKNYQELSGQPAYQAWIDQNGKAPFPGGEDPAAFGRRSVEALQELLGEEGLCHGRAAFVVHGGTIMAVFSALDEKPKGFYDYQVENGGGYWCRAERLGGVLAFCSCRKL